jgi:hypothetical protein
MKSLSWNCRGLGNPSAVRALKKLLKTQSPNVVFLMETRLKKSDPKAKCSLLCGPLSNLFIIDCSIANGHRLEVWPSSGIMMLRLRLFKVIKCSLTVILLLVI